MTETVSVGEHYVRGTWCRGRSDEDDWRGGDTMSGALGVGAVLTGTAVLLLIAC